VSLLKHQSLLNTDSSGKINREKYLLSSISAMVIVIVSNGVINKMNSISSTPISNYIMSTEKNSKTEL